MANTRTLDRLPPLSKSKNGGRFWKAGKSLPSKKPALSIVEVKKLTKLMEALGKPVTAITSHGNGAFTVNTSDVSNYPDEKNPFDEVLT